MPQAVKALEHLKPRTDAGPYSWTAGPYDYDGAGNIKAIGSESFVYDKLGRLRSASVRGPDAVSLQTQTFGYDAYGNLISTSKLGQTVLLSVDTRTNQLDGTGYDASGNVITSGARNYAYDAVGMLSVITLGGSQQPRVVYAYTADDERLFSYDVGTGVTHWTLRGLDNKVLRDFKQQGGAWSVERDYVYRDGLLLAALKPNGDAEHYTLDHLGTPRLITDGTGHKIGYHAYWPFGEEWSPGSAQEGNPLQFTGHERDADPSNGAAGLDSMHARYYRAGWGRFMSTDAVLDIEKALSLPQAWNRYSYADDNPILKVDPDGKQAAIPAPTPGAAAPLSLALYHAQQMQTNSAYREAAVSLVMRNAAIVNALTTTFFGIVSRGSPLPLLMAKKRDEARGGAVPGEAVNPGRARQLGERAKEGSVADAVDQLDSILDRQTKIRQGKADGVIDSIGKSEQRIDNVLDRIRSLADAVADAMEEAEEDEHGPESGSDQKPPARFD